MPGFTRKKPAFASACVMVAAGFLSLPVTNVSATEARQPAAYSFGDFAVPSLYRGKTQLPDFSGRDKKYKDYRSRIREGLKGGPDFAGHFSVVQVGCGSGCSLTFIADNESGQVFELPRGGEEHAFVQLLYKPNSRLLVAQWGDPERAACMIEYFEWTGLAAKSLRTTEIGRFDDCHAGLEENLSHAAKSMRRGIAECYARTYDIQHLAAHSDQRVTSMALGLRARREDPNLFDGVVAATVRGSDRRLLTMGQCQRAGRDSFDCGIECDGGSFQLRPSSRTGSLRLVLERIYFDGACGFGDGTGDGYELLPGKDDKVFRLDHSADARCEALFAEIDRQGSSPTAAD